jgi:lysophospholipase L1-like esterase
MRDWWLGIMLSILLVGVLEYSARLVLDQVYNRSFDHNLIEPHKYGQSDGLHAQAKGMVWGQTFTTDIHGCRNHSSKPSSRKKRWLIGDSVIEGVGVADTATFAHRLHLMSHDEVHNLSHIGWSTTDYSHALDYILDTLHTDSSSTTSISICYCLNDIYAAKPTSLLPPIGNKGIISTLNQILQTSSGLYKLIKLYLYQHSDHYYRYDAVLYKDTAMVQYTVRLMQDMYLRCQQRHIALDVYLLPYHSQLTHASTGSPQDILIAACGDIHVYDLQPALRQYPHPDELYLWGDEIHLSALGHSAVAHAMLNSD